MCLHENGSVSMRVRRRNNAVTTPAPEGHGAFGKNNWLFFSVALFYMLIVVANLKGSLDLRLEPQSKSTISVPESLSAHYPPKIGRFWEITTVSYHKSMTLKEAEYTVNWRVIE